MTCIKETKFLESWRVCFFLPWWLLTCSPSSTVHRQLWNALVCLQLLSKYLNTSRKQGRKLLYRIEEHLARLFPKVLFVQMANEYSLISVVSHNVKHIKDRDGRPYVWKYIARPLLIFRVHVVILPWLHKPSSTFLFWTTPSNFSSIFGILSSAVLSPRLLNIILCSFQVHCWAELVYCILRKMWTGELCLIFRCLLQFCFHAQKVPAMSRNQKLLFTNWVYHTYGMP